ncbi:helix-turn-helix domain-containing protein [Dyadobacter sp. CY345]|uniref:helix-turn-helix domain-containing protein n=1 Tax=Dyadobacter sp. CY345 TaxID=2909335 RepID=UPI001F2B539D|nr:helix-turn-helix domain-containing protein [Dyadobacter sp. CY345]MCF2443264.1 helix-turn-helix domain-containing protein [Dyadobacter sp. CY345]
MSEIFKLESVSQFNAQRGQRTLHPLVSVLDQSKSKPIQGARFVSELYIIFLKKVKCEELKYGRSHYDYQDGTLLFIAPGQVFGFDDDENMFQPTGWVLVFHPDLIRGTSLGRSIKDYGFFSYDVNEALHLSEHEREVILDSFSKIRYELEQAIDKHSKTLVISNIELFLNYCMRFYDRQFITRDNIHKDILTRFESALNDFFGSDAPQIVGLPSVRFFAEKLNLSANYFGDLVKKETGKSAHDHIQEKLINVAKERVLGSNRTISEIAYEIGFKYPSHFTRLFKQQVGKSPVDFRLSSN